MNYQQTLTDLQSLHMSVKNWHWIPTDRWAHADLGNLYDDMADELDVLMELVIGQKPKEYKQPLSLALIPNVNIVNVLKEYQTALQKASVEESSVDIQNSMINMKGILSKYIYLLSQTK